MKLNTEQRVPIIKEGEKLRVANAERNKPSISKEKDFMSNSCWYVGGVIRPRNKNPATTIGNVVLIRRKVYIAKTKY